MKAEEAKRIAQIAVTIKSLSKIFEKIKKEAELGKNSVYVAYSEMSNDQMNALISKELGYKVSPVLDDDDFGDSRRTVGFDISWR